MMNAQHNILENKCGKAFKAVRTRLQYEYKALEYKPIAQDCDKLKKAENWRGLFLISKKIFNIDIELIIAIPYSFPYIFPKIYLSSEVPVEFKNLPHVDDNLFVCTFDSNEAIPNPDEPALVLAKVITRAIEIIKKGLSKNNFNDYDEEIIAYWNLDTKYDIISIIKPDNNPKEIHIIPIENNKIFSYLIADSIFEGITWANNSQIKYNKKKISRGLYLPLKNLGIPPFPDNNQKIVKYLEETNPEILDIFYNFLDNNKRPSLIVFGIQKDTTWVLGGWQHKVYKLETYKGKKTHTICHQKGFRNGHQISSLELTGFAKDLIVDRCEIHRFDKERLFIRGGNGLNINQDYSINIIGCGSVGSFLIYELIKLGFNEFRFIDKELLSVENIARHYCGVQYIGFAKVNALKDIFCKNYPHLSISVEKNDARNLIIQDLDYLNSFDLNIICVADYSLELLINHAYKNNLLKTNILIVWVEPYLQAGQAVLMMPQKEGCFSCLFEYNSKINFKYRISETIDTYTKRESGCQSTYVPYGAIDITSFTNFLARIVEKIHNKEYKENILFQWIKNTDNLGGSFKIYPFSKLENFEFCELCKEVNA